VFKIPAGYPVNILLFYRRKGLFMQVVKTDKGYVAGTVMGEPGNPVSIFRGIPYAAPPVGDLRWRAPQPAAPWQGIRECTQFGGISPQVNADPSIAHLIRTEDCLYLNVVTPAKKPGEKLPVMVWMHGGGYFAGCGDDQMWNSWRLAQHGVVLVSLTHRLGPIGLLAHADLSKESPQGVSGNYLFLDLIASLQWVKNNIAAFGGDPKNVTIFGESGGGAKVCMMLVSPLAKGLFHRAICESGTAMVISPSKPLKDVEKAGAELFSKLGVKTLEEARRLPWEKIIEAGETIGTPGGPGGKPMPPWDAAVDGWVLPQSPREHFENGSINAVPLITCANLGELTGPGILVMPAIIQAYVKMLEGMNKAGVSGYAGVFDHIPDNWRKAGVVSFHAIELPYVFGDWDDSTRWWGSIVLSQEAFGIKMPGIILNNDDKQVSEFMMELWTSFAKTGKPKAKGVPDWPAYVSGTDKYMYMETQCQVREGYSKVAQDVKTGITNL
jgi:para-nitrobenzyl esterase